MGLKNFTSINTGYSRERRARIAWVRGNIGAVVGNGRAPDEADLAELPPAVWPVVRAHAKLAVAAWDRGEQNEARRIAEALVSEVDGLLDDKWQPPREKPDRDLLDEIQGRGLYS